MGFMDDLMGMRPQMDPQAQLAFQRKMDLEQQQQAQQQQINMAQQKNPMSLQAADLIRSVQAAAEQNKQRMMSPQDVAALQASASRPQQGGLGGVNMITPLGADGTYPPSTGSITPPSTNMDPMELKKLLMNIGIGTMQ